mmetsp:Transcript_33304/g.54016  ORF Transcript_33304/g.54016 Transcript_33304/m.54016 type:complete len:123 (+) Transcript_33304:843-1211(+)
MLVEVEGSAVLLNDGVVGYSPVANVDVVVPNADWLEENNADDVIVDVVCPRRPNKRLFVESTNADGATYDAERLNEDDSDCCGTTWEGARIVLPLRSVDVLSGWWCVEESSSSINGGEIALR